MADNLSPEELRELAELEAIDQGLSFEEAQELAELEAMENKPINRKEQADALLEGAAAGVTFNFSDELQAGIQKTMNEGQEMLNNLGLAGQSPEQVNQSLMEKGFTGDLEVDIYDQALNESRSRLKLLKENYPVAFTAGEIGGGLLVPGASLKVAKNAGKAVKAGIIGAEAFGAGSLDELGRSEEDFLMTDVENVLFGGAFSAATAGVGSLIPGGMSAAGSKLRQISDKRASKKLAKSVSRIKNALGIYSEGAEKIWREQIKAKGWDPDIFTDRLVRAVDLEGKPLFLSANTREELLSKINDISTSWGNGIGRTIKQSEEIAGKKIKTSLLAGEIQETLSTKYSDPRIRAAELPDADLKDISTRLNELVQQDEITFEDLWGLRSRIIKNKGGWEKMSEPHRDLVREMGDILEDEVFLKAGPEAQEALRRSREDVGLLREYSKFVRKEADFDRKGIVGKAAKLMNRAGWVVRGKGGVALRTGGALLSNQVVSKAFKTFSKNPSLEPAKSSLLGSIGDLMSGAVQSRFITPENVSLKLMNAARSAEEFENEMQRVMNTSQGIINDEQEAAELKTNVLNSNFGPRRQMQMMAEIDSGRIPIFDEQTEEPFFKQYEPRSRSTSGKKI